MSKEFCKHYRAMALHDTCEIGIPYKNVAKNKTDGPGVEFSCWSSEYKTCPHAVYPTEEEIQQENARIGEIVKQFFSNLNSDICPHCKQPIQEKKQIGRCVYAYPCGHRLYQGRLGSLEDKKE